MAGLFGAVPEDDPRLRRGIQNVSVADWNKNAKVRTQQRHPCQLLAKRPTLEQWTPCCVLLMTRSGAALVKTNNLAAHPTAFMSSSLFITLPQHVPALMLVVMG